MNDVYDLLQRKNNELYNLNKVNKNKQINLLEKHNKLISLYETKLNDLLNKNTEKTEELNPEECILNNKNFKKEYDEL